LEEADALDAEGFNGVVCLDAIDVFEEVEVLGETGSLVELDGFVGLLAVRLDADESAVDFDEPPFDLLWALSATWLLLFIVGILFCTYSRRTDESIEDQYGKLTATHPGPLMLRRRKS
jgi:hypothetical protein